MEWKDISITVPHEEGEAAEAIATSVSGSGIYIEDYADLEEQVQAIAHVDLIEEELRARDRSILTVHLYLSPEEDPAQVVALLEQRLQAAGLHADLRVAGVEEADWENGWKAFYHAMEIGRRLAVCPSWERYEKPGRVVLRLDPGMAFGTGTHETTALCLQALDELVVGGERVLDIGTGSGILSIAALLLGAGQAQGVDIDPMCVRTAAENAALNGVSDRFEAQVGDLSDRARGRYDLICANLVANAVIALAPALPGLLAEGGRVIASGIITQREAEVAAALRAAGLALPEIRRRNGWACIIACAAGGSGGPGR